MKYINAADILPEKLLRQLQTYIDGDVLYIPKASKKMEWGKEIQRLYKEGHSMEALAKNIIWHIVLLKNNIWMIVRRLL